MNPHNMNKIQFGFHVLFLLPLLIIELIGAAINWATDELADLSFFSKYFISLICWIAIGFLIGVLKK